MTALDYARVAACLPPIKRHNACDAIQQHVFAALQEFVGVGMTPGYDPSRRANQLWKDSTKLAEVVVQNALICWEVQGTDGVPIVGIAQSPEEFDKTFGTIMGRHL